MTLIAAFANDSGAWMAGDRAAAEGTDMHLISSPKIHRPAPWLLMGYTYSFRAGQLIEHGLEWEDAKKSEPPADKDADAFAFYLADAMIKRLKSGDWLKKNNERAQGGQWLIAWANHVYTIESDFSFIGYARNYSAIGCGMDFALGAMHLMDTISGSTNPESMMKVGMQAGKEFSSGVRWQGDFDLISTDGATIPKPPAVKPLKRKAARKK